ncbi:MAG: hypothetical protein GY874_20855 [Desulfobacteraceae bacterium]|nr:hypothetical protein [Desulfobacteraceae bacterium]
MDNSNINISLRDLLHVFFKRKRIITIFFVTVTCMTTIVTMLMPSKYQSTAQIMINVGRENLHSRNREPYGQVISRSLTNYANSEIQLIKSRAIAEKVLNKLGPGKIFKSLKTSEKNIGTSFDAAKKKSNLLGKAIAAYQDCLAVSQVKDSSIIKVGFKHKDPDISAQVTNTLLYFYIEHHLSIHSPNHSYLFFEKQSQILKDQLNQSEMSFAAFKKEHNIKSLPEERKLLLEQSSTLETALKKTNSNIIEVNYRIAMFEDYFPEVSHNLPKTLVMEPDMTIVNSLQSKLTDLELEKKKLLLQFKKDSRFITNISEEIKSIKNQLYSSLKANNVALQTRRKIQRNQLAECSERLDMLNQLESDYQKLQSEVLLGRDNYRLYLGKIEETRMSKAMDSEKIANVSIMESATPPLTPESPKVMLNIALGIFFGIFGGISIAFCLEYFDDTIDSVKEIEDLLRVPVLASIPAVES